MLDHIGEAGLENTAGDGFEGHAEAEIGLLPELLLAVFKEPERFRLLGAVAHAAVGAEHLDEPRVRLAGGHALHFEAQRHVRAVDLRPSVQQSIVPGVAGGHAAFAVRALRVAFLKLREQTRRFPAETQRNVAGMHTEIAQHADFAAGGGFAFPVRGLRGVQIAAVMESADDFENAAKFAAFRLGDDALRAGQKREFRAAAHKTARTGTGGRNSLRRAQIDAEGFFGKQVFSGREHVEIDLFVQIVRHGHIHDLHGRIGEQFVVIRSDLRAGRHAAEPLTHGLDEIRHGDELRLHLHVGQSTPAGKSAGHFPAHEAAADDADADFFHEEVAGVIFRARFSERVPFSRARGQHRP